VGKGKISATTLTIHYTMLTTEKLSEYEKPRSAENLQNLHKSAKLGLIEFRLEFIA
jgi:hypothetical protein